MRILSQQIQLLPQLNDRLRDHFTDQVWDHIWAQIRDGQLGAILEVSSVVCFGAVFGVTT